VALPGLNQGSKLPTIEGYELQNYLGEGGMGVVYRARELKTNELVALKVLSRVDAGGIYRLKREFRTLAGIVHPNVARLIELRVSDEICYFTMELVRGTSFLEYLGVEVWAQEDDATSSGESSVAESRRPRSGRAIRFDGGNQARLRDAFAQVVLGIRAVHEAQLLHCDIKPSNLLVEEGGRVVVLDFGVTSGFGHDPFRTEGEIAGTPAYMSPEQASGGALGPASDWYAVGVVLYEALCGVLPFEGSRLRILQDKQTQKPTPPSSVRADVPGDLEALCLDLLAVDPALRPDVAEILRRLAAPGLASATQLHATVRDTTTVFIGREGELGALRSAASQVSPGSPVVALISGRSGIGKSALVHEFLRQELGPGSLLLRGRCYERESVPYKAFDPVIDELTRFLRRLTDREVAELLPRDVRSLSRVFPVLNRVRAVAEARGRAADVADPVEVRRRASLALKELLVRLCDTWKVIIYIDDLQWSDRDSARMLADVLEPPDPPSLMVLLSSRERDETLNPILEELRSKDQSHHLHEAMREIELSEMPAADATALAQALLGAPDDALAASIARESVGYPMFVRELALRAKGAQGQPGGPRSQEGIEAVLHERIAALPAHLRRLLDFVAIAGQPILLSLVLTVSGAEGGEGAARPLAEAGLVRLMGRGPDALIECYHDRIREVIELSLAPERRAEYHHALAVALEARGDGEPDALVEHYFRAGNTPRASELALTSASAAADSLAFSRAARFYRLALEMLPPTADATQLVPLKRRLADMLANEGRLGDAALLYGELAQLHDGTEAIELLRLSAQHFLTSGSVAEGLTALQTVLPKVGLKYPKTPGAAVARLAWERLLLRLFGLSFVERAESEIPKQELARADVCFSAAVGLAMCDLVRSAAFSAQHLRIALRIGEPSRIARGLAFEMGIAPGAGEEGLRWASRALPVAERLSKRHGGAYHHGLFFLAQGHLAHLSGQWKAASDWLLRAEKSLRESRAADVHWALLSGNVLAAISSAVSGDLTITGERLPAIMKEARQRGDSYSQALMVYPGIVLSLARDRVDLAEKILADVARPPSDRSFDLRDFTTFHCALLIDRYKGDSERAWQRIAENWPRIVRSKILVVNIVRISALAERGSAAVSMAEAEGPDRAAQLRIAKSCAKQRARERLPHGRALAKLLSARVARVAGDREGALSTLNDASLHLETAGLALHAQCSRRCIGSLMGGSMGSILVAEVDVALRASGVRDPARFAEMMTPGFASRPES